MKSGRYCEPPVSLSPTHSFLLSLSLSVFGAALETAKESDHRLWLHNVVPRAPWAPVTNTHTRWPPKPGQSLMQDQGALMYTSAMLGSVGRETERERE